MFLEAHFGEIEFHMPDADDDELGEDEHGASLLVRLDEAEALYDSLCARATPLGLLSEEIDPTDGSFLGNFPQAFSHLGVIASGWKIAQARRAEAGRR